MPTATLKTRAVLVSRIAASLFGSYAFVWGFVTLLVALQVRAGIGYGDARTLAYLLAFLVFLGSFLWSFAAASVVRVWVTLAGAGIAMTGGAWLLVRQAAT